MIKIPYCTVDEVKAAIDFPSTGAPVSDADILEFIYDAQAEIEDIYKTKFANQEQTGTATAATDSSLTDSGSAWTVDAYKNMTVHITGGTGAGQYRNIVSNTAEILNVEPNWDTNPDATSTFEILTLGYVNEVVDGSGTNTQFVEYQPLVNLISLEVDSTAITSSSVYQYPASGKLVLSSSSEVQYFSITEPQLVNLHYIYGVNELPRIIKRLCVIMAAMRTLTSQIAGTYDDFTSISLPGLTGSKGEPYTNIREALSRMQAEARGIVYGELSEALGADMRKYPSYRPFVVFG